MDTDEKQTLREVIAVVKEIQELQTYITSAKIQYEIIEPLEELIKCTT